jgi:hypothetical protein
LKRAERPIGPPLSPARDSLTAAGRVVPVAGVVLPVAGTVLPEAGKAVPGTGVTAPAAGIAMPERGVVVPVVGMAMPATGVSMPATGVALPKTSVIVPKTGAGMPGPGQRGQVASVSRSASCEAGGGRGQAFSEISSCYVKGRIGLSVPWRLSAAPALVRVGLLNPRPLEVSVVRKMVFLGLTLLAVVGAVASVPRAEATACDWYCADGNVICPCDPRICRVVIPPGASC